MVVCEQEAAIFTGSMDDTVKKWCMKSGKVQKTMKGHTGTVKTHIYVHGYI